MSVDYIIVGSGTAGCALAASLSERSDVTVRTLKYSSKYLNDRSESIVLLDDTSSDAHLLENIPDEIMQTSYTALENYNLKADEGASTLFCVLLRPHSKGALHLVSADPSVRPICDLGYLADS